MIGHMGQWRIVSGAVVVLGAIAVLGAQQTSAWLVLPPLAAAAVALLAAALAVDYFGMARRRTGWGGLGANSRQTWTRTRALEHRFDDQRAKGSPRTSWTARSLLIALAECDRLDDASAVVDFLGADAVHGRIGVDVTADALRAVALAELGRTDQARELCDALERSRRHRSRPVVGYAVSRVAEIDGQAAVALSRVEKTLQYHQGLARRRRLTPSAQRDLRMLRARCLASLSRHHDATRALAELVADGFQREVEQLVEQAAARGHTALAVAARQALLEASPYR